MNGFLKIKYSCSSCGGSGNVEVHISASNVLWALLDGYDQPLNGPWNKILAIKALRNYLTPPSGTISNLGLADAKMLIEGAYEIFKEVNDENNSKRPTPDTEDTRIGHFETQDNEISESITIELLIDTWLRSLKRDSFNYDARTLYERSKDSG